MNPPIAPLPHPLCDESCLYHCTEAGAHPPDCLPPPMVHIPDTDAHLALARRLCKENGYDPDLSWNKPIVEKNARLIGEAEAVALKPLLEEIKRLESALFAANSLCRSAYRIAGRAGADTDWASFHDQLALGLDEQHKVMYGPIELGVTNQP